MQEDKREFPSIARCDPEGRSQHAVAADLDGTLLVSRSSFPYFMLLAVEAGGYLRGVLLLLASPLILFLYRLVSEAAGIQLLIFISVAGLRVRDIELASREVLPRFYAADVRADSWRAFRACGRRRVVVTANPTVMVDPFVKRWLGGHKVLGTRLQVDPWTSGRATGLVAAPGVLVGSRKREAVEREFAAEGMPELALGDRDSDHDFMTLCEEGYMVHPDPSAARVPPEELASNTGFRGVRFVRRPEPHVALVTFLWMPIGFFLSLLRLFLTNFPLPPRLLRHCFRLSGVDLAVRGTPPPPAATGSRGTLLICCNPSPALVPLVLGAALGRRVPCVAYGERPGGCAADAARISALLEAGDVVVCFDGTTTGREREEPLLRQLSAMFADLSNRIVPVAIETRQAVFRGTTWRGHSFLDPCFFFMNPRPGYEVTFLQERLPAGEVGMQGREAGGGGGEPRAGVAGGEAEVRTHLRRRERRGGAGEDDALVLGASVWRS